MAATQPKTTPRPPLVPVLTIAAEAPGTRAATAHEREVRLQTRADAIRRELEPALGHRGMVLGDRDLDGLSRAIASESVLSRSVTLELIARRTHIEEEALGNPDAVESLIAKDDGHGLGPVF